MKRYFYLIALAFSAISLTACSGGNEQETIEEKPRNIIYGIDADGYQVENFEVVKGDTWGRILDSRGITTQKVSRLDVLTKEICPLRTIRIGHKYTTFSKRDTVDTARMILDYLVYEQNVTD
ncbi:MAG: metalloendopeptidase, partial [Alistipes sp.]|nr:metalloendopeptidase [Alistipes sp.]